jgi:hypothetical protein
MQGWPRLTLPALLPLPLPLPLALPLLLKRFVSDQRLALQHTPIQQHTAAAALRQVNMRKRPSHWSGLHDPVLHICEPRAPAYCRYCNE